MVCLLVSNCRAMAEIDTPFRSRSFTWAWRSGVGVDGRPKGLPTKSSEMPSESSSETCRIRPRKNGRYSCQYREITSVLYVKLDVASRTFVGTNPMLFTDGELSIVDAEISVRQICSIRDEWTSSASFPITKLSSTDLSLKTIGSRRNACRKTVILSSSSYITSVFPCSSVGSSLTNHRVPYISPTHDRNRSL